MLPFLGGDISKEECQKLYESHFKRIRELVPRERLLEYEVKQGWPPLCNFLGVEEPMHEFPWANDKEELLKFVWNQTREASWRVMGSLTRGVVTVVIVVAIAILWMRWSKA